MDGQNTVITKMTIKSMIKSVKFFNLEKIDPIIKKNGKNKKNNNGRRCI